MKNVVVLTEDGAFALVSFPPRGIGVLLAAAGIDLMDNIFS